MHAGFCLLGCPICPASLYEGVLQDRVTKIRESLEILHEMGDSQLETTLIHSCLALPKFSYLISTCRPTYISQATRDFDVAMREALESILGGPLSEWSWLKALHFPAAMVETTSKALPSMPQPLFWHPTLALKR